ncbi:MAG: hypothetical protein ACE5H8_13290 [Alphaproteobacteria bacterium]
MAKHRFTWADCAVCVADRGSRARALIERYLGLASAPAEDDADGPLAAGLERRGDGYRVRGLFGEMDTDNWSDAAYLLLEAVAYGFALSTRRLVVHAGSIVDGGGAIVCFGAPWAGKSSLSFAAWRRGLRVLGDDRVCLDPTKASARAYPKCLKLRLADDDPPACVAEALAADDAFVGALGDDRRLVLSRGLAGFVAYDTAFPIRALVRIERGAGPRSRLDMEPVIDALDDILVQASLTRFSPMDLVRLVKTQAPGERIPRLRVAPDDTDSALDLLLKV